MEKTNKAGKWSEREYEYGFAAEDGQVEGGKEEGVEPPIRFLDEFHQMLLDSKQK